VMLIVRFLFGVGEAGAYPNIARALGRWFPVRERAGAQSFIWMSSRLGGASAPLIIGGLMFLAGDWQRAFWILGGVGVAWALFFRLWYRDRPEDVPAVNEAERDHIRGQAERGSIYDDTAAPPPFRWRVLFSANVLAVCLASYCVSFCFYFYITFLPKYLKDQFQVDYSQSQWSSGLPLLVGAAACLLGGFLSDFAVRRLGKRWGRAALPIAGWTAAGVCAFGVSALASPTAVFLLIVLAFACQDLGVPSMWSVPADIGGRYAGTIGGWMNAAGAVGGMVSPLVAAQVYMKHGWNAVFVVFGVVYLIGAAAWLRINAEETIADAATLRES
jgi:ACS family glucarate transporter-like MFS transporter